MQRVHSPVSPAHKTYQQDDDEEIYSRAAHGRMQEQVMETKIMDEPDSPGPSHSQYVALSYGSNYYSVLSSAQDDKARQRSRIENETLLKQYYSAKKMNSHAVYRHGSVISCVESTSSACGSMPGSHNRISRTWLNKFLDSSDDLADSFDFQSTFHTRSSSKGSAENSERKQIMESRCLKTYYNHFQKLLTVDVRDPELLKRFNLWMPIVTKEFRPIVLAEGLDTRGPYDKKISPLFLEGSKYVPREYDTYDGCTIFPSFFSEYKLPSFCYHTGVELNGQIFIMGGLVACHKYDEEAPSLRDFDVDGVCNLPPPLLPRIINNPSMINNSRLYVISTPSCRISRPVISGALPPPLLCMKSSKLTERHIFYYGGFEIKTETVCDTQGLFHLKKRAFLNNTGYILDTMTFKFSKIELMALPYKFVTYPTLAARFGHMQISVMANKCYLNHGQKSNDCCDDANLASQDNDRPTSESTSALDTPPLSATAASRPTNNHSSGIYTIIIFGGYRQTGDEKYEAMNDMWKIEVPIVAKGKRGYYKFGDTASASIISKVSDSDPWPECRAFFGTGVEDSDLLNKSLMQANLMKRLEEDFRVDSKSREAKSKTKPIFPNIPHMRREVPSPKLSSSSRDNSFSASSSLKQRFNPSMSTSTITLQQSISRKQNEGKIIVIHGGSNKTKVLSDMWWFDVDSETWSNVTIFRKSEKDGLIPVNLGLVGHSMLSVGHTCVCLGGLTQADVNEMYLADKVIDNSTDSEAAATEDFIKIIDLTTQCLQGHEAEARLKNGELSTEQGPEEAPSFNTSLMMSFGCTVLHVNGWIILVGGLVAKRSNINDIYMRGAILECVLPSVNLAS